MLMSRFDFCEWSVLIRNLKHTLNNSALNLNSGLKIITFLILKCKIYIYLHLDY